MTLKEFLKGVADAIRYAEGSTGAIPAPDYAARIKALAGSGGGGGVVQPILIPLEITENGTYEPETGVDGFSSVVANVEAETPVLTVLEVTQNGVYIPADGISGYLKVIVNVQAAVARCLGLGDIESSVGVSGLAVDAEGTISMTGSATWSIIKLNPSIKKITGKRSSAKFWIAYKDNGDGTYNCLEPGNLWNLTAGSSAATKLGSCSVSDVSAGTMVTVTLSDNTLTVTNESGGTVVAVADANMIGFWSSASGNAKSVPINGITIIEEE